MRAKTFYLRTKLAGWLLIQHCYFTNIYRILVLTGDGDPEPHALCVADPVQGERYYVLAPEYVLCVAAACHRRDFAPETDIVIH